VRVAREVHFVHVFERTRRPTARRRWAHGGWRSFDRLGECCDTGWPMKRRTTVIVIR
jgi:hypothetical protein